MNHKKKTGFWIWTWKWGPGCQPGMAKRALAGLIEAGSDVVATRRDTIGWWLVEKLVFDDLILWRQWFRWKRGWREYLIGRQELMIVPSNIYNLDIKVPFISTVECSNLMGCIFFHILIYFYVFPFVCKGWHRLFYMVGVFTHYDLC
jgi:hypothetical protein